MAAFVGRERELAALVAALAGPPAVAVVEGEAGIGKTRLVAELRAHAALAEWRFVVGACPRIREPFPLGPVIEAIGGLDGELARVSLSPVVGTLRPLLPELGPLLPLAPEPLDDRVAERHRVFRGLAELLGAVGPAVLVLEDLHWADEQTIDFISYLVGDPPPQVSLLLTFRGAEVDPRVRALTAKRPAPVTRADVVLAPLEAAQAGELAAGILGLSRVSEEFASYLCERTAGLPFAIEELLALLQDQGRLVHRDGRWARKALDELDVPTGIRDQVLERVSRLSGDARSVVEAAAVLQAPAPMAVLVATCRSSRARALRGAEAALEPGLLVEQGDVVGFRHVLAAQAVYEAMPGPRRQDLHARAASAVATLDPVPLGQQAHHLRRAGQLDQWVDVAERAADQATALGHDDEAARLLRDLLVHLPRGDARRGPLAVKLARAASQMLYMDDGVIGLLSDVLDQEPPHAVRGELRLRLAFLLERSGADFHLQRPLFVQAVEDLEDRPDLMAQAMVVLGFPYPGVPITEHGRWLRRVLEIIPKVDDQAVRIGLLGKVAMVQVAVGDPQWRQLVDDILEHTAGEPRRGAEITAFNSVGPNLCYAGHLATADRLLAVALAAAKRHETRWRELASWAAIAFLDYCRGSWDGLAERVEALRDQLADLAPSRAEVEVVTACLTLARGELDRADVLLHDLLQRFEERGAFDLIPIPANAQLRLALGRGETDRAAARAHQFVTIAESVPLVVSVAWALPAVTEAMTAGGLLGEAQDLVARWERQLAGLDAPLASAAIPHAHGILAAAARDWSAAAPDFSTAALEYERLTCPYEAAQAHERAGDALLRAGETEQGAAELGAALTAFQTLGATWDLDRASATARQHGVPVPARHRRGRKGYGTDLSPREREVAKLVASGRTNKEIADELFVSVKTIEQHVSAVMRKLDVPSRRSIGRRLA